MSGLATKPTKRSVANYIAAIESPSKQEDSNILVALMEELSGEPAVVWGNDKVPDFLIGFGEYNYRRKGGKEDFLWFKVGFAPRKSKITLYLTTDLKQQEGVLSRLGKCKHGAGCLYINKLADIDLEVLKELIVKSL